MEDSSNNVLSIYVEKKEKAEEFLRKSLFARIKEVAISRSRILKNDTYSSLSGIDVFEFVCNLVFILMLPVIIPIWLTYWFINSFVAWFKYKNHAKTAIELGKEAEAELMKRSIASNTRKHNWLFTPIVAEDLDKNYLEAINKEMTENMNKDALNRIKEYGK